MATIPKRPVSKRDHRRDDGEIRRMLGIATGRAARVKPDPHSLDNEGRQRARPITLATTPYNWRDGPDKR